MVVDCPVENMGILSLPHGVKKQTLFSGRVCIMSTFFDDAFLLSPGHLNEDEIFDFRRASSGVSTHNPDDQYDGRTSVEDAEFSDVGSDNSDGLFTNSASTFVGSPELEEAEEEEDIATGGEQVQSWKIDHSSGDHKLRRRLEQP